MADVLKIVKPSTEAQRTTQTALDTIEVTPDLMKSWKLPPFQRPLKVNDRVRAVSASILADEGVIPGVITLEFVNLNSRLVTMKPDDILRGLEASTPALAKVRKRCTFVGYDQVRRGERSPIVSMSALLRCWFASAPDVPSTGGLTSTTIVDRFTEDEADSVIAFLEVAMAAWGRDPEYMRLWTNLNLTICMWLYRRLVITPYSPKTPKFTHEQFQNAVMGLSTDEGYLQWLLGRQLRDRDRSPCYQRVKSIIVKRYELVTGKKISLPAPSWVGGTSR